jgi:hypothetical protein
MLTGVMELTPVLGLLAMGLLPAAVLALPDRLIKSPVEQVVGLLHCAAQFTLWAPLSADSQAWVVGVTLVLIARK